MNKRCMHLFMNIKVDGLNMEFRDNTPLQEQVDALAKFIIAEIPGEPSRSGGAVETAIRLLRDAYVKDQHA